MENYEELKDYICKIDKMDLNKSFKQLFEELKEAIKENNKGKCWAMVDNLYPSIKLEENINQNEKEYIKEFLLKC